MAGVDERVHDEAAGALDGDGQLLGQRDASELLEDTAGIAGTSTTEALAAMDHAGAERTTVAALVVSMG